MVFSIIYKCTCYPPTSDVLFSDRVLLVPAQKRTSKRHSVTPEDYLLPPLRLRKWLRLRLSLSRRGSPRQIYTNARNIAVHTKVVRTVTSNAVDCNIILTMYVVLYCVPVSCHAFTVIHPTL